MHSCELGTSNELVLKKIIFYQLDSFRIQLVTVFLFSTYVVKKIGIQIFQHAVIEKIKSQCSLLPNEAKYWDVFSSWYFLHNVDFFFFFLKYTT